MFTGSCITECWKRLSKYLEHKLAFDSRTLQKYKNSITITSFYLTKLTISLLAFAENVGILVFLLSSVNINKFYCSQGLEYYSPRKTDQVTK